MKKFNYFGINICATNLTNISDYIQTEIKKKSFNKGHHVAFPDTFAVTVAQSNEKLKMILNNTWLTLPDGKPCQFYANRIGLKNVSTVSGYWLCKELLNTELTHYFYGTTNDVLAKLKQRINSEFPNANIIGFKSAPFISLNEIEFNAQIQADFIKINRLSPDLVWVGLSSPKQDYLIYHHKHILKKSIVLGVGAVFDYLSGNVQKSPEWVKKIGFRWLWRLVAEPKRLWKRYYLIIKKIGYKYFIMMIKKK